MCVRVYLCMPDCMHAHIYVYAWKCMRLYIMLTAPCVLIHVPYYTYTTYFQLRWHALGFVFVLRVCVRVGVCVCV